MMQTFADFIIILPVVWDFLPPGFPEGVRWSSSSVHPKSGPDGSREPDPTQYFFCQPDPIYS